MVETSVEGLNSHRTLLGYESAKLDVLDLKILKGSLDSIQSPLPLVKIQIIGGKVYLG